MNEIEIELLKLQYKQSRVFQKQVGCGDCMETHIGYCPLCKKKGGKFRSNVGVKLFRSRNWSCYEVVNHYTIIAFRDRPPSNEPKKEKKKPVRSKKEKNNSNLFATQKPKQPTPITKDNFHIATYGWWQEIPELIEGYELIHKSKGSAYWASPCGEILIRKSDHWGYQIKYCDWFIKGYKKMHCTHWRRNFGVKMAWIRVSDLQTFREEITRNEELVDVK